MKLEMIGNARRRRKIWKFGQNLNKKGLNARRRGNFGNYTMLLASLLFLWTNLSLSQSLRQSLIFSPNLSLGVSYKIVSYKKKRVYIITYNCIY